MTENILQKLQESQERFLFTPPYTPQFFQTVLKYVNDAILFVTLDGIITVMNEAARKNLPLPEQDPGTPRFWEVLPDDYFGFSMKEALNFGISHKLLYRSFPNKELEISSTFLFEGPKSCHGLLIFFRDITEKHRLQSEIHRNDRMKQLGEMTASTAHEIRNPLGGIRGYASLLYRDLEKQKNLQEMAGLIIDGTKALERLVTGVLQYARPIQILPQSVEIGNFLRQLIKFIKVDPATPKGIQWHVHITDDPLIAPIDPDTLRSALLNLIFNSFQAMLQGGEITVSLLKGESCYQIAISDTGIGMDEEQMKRIFSPFFTTKDKGNGLGLVEVKKIVQAHYGTIDVRSAVGKGTTFTLAFPLYRAALNYPNKGFKND